jgi:asparagine N-glycosylation enzyme membrane subunit Stt3
VHEGHSACFETEQEDAMLYTLAVILLIAWLLGIVGTYTIGAFVHVLLVVAIVLFLVGLLSGRQTVV